MDKINFAILGPGAIADMMARTVAQIPDIRMYAVASRDATRAAAFAQQHGFEKSYGSYEEMVQDDKVQLVYVATPHSHHAQHAKLCLEHGRAVLCEKAFTANARQAKELVALAQANNTLLAEAMWTRYMPLAATIRELVQSGAIGRPAMLTGNLSYPLTHVQRLTDPALAGGALLDLGIYPLTFAAIAFGGDVERVSSSAVLLDTGVDAQNSITLHFKGGHMASLFSSIWTHSVNNGYVYGDEGHLFVPNTNNFESVQVFAADHTLKASYERPPQTTGYEHEVLACVRALREGRIECPELPHAEIIRMMELMDSMRAEWGMRFPFE